MHNGLFALDLILCRNVLIYFDQATIEAVERRLFAALAPGGFVLLGPSDPMLGKHAPFEVRITDHGLCYQRPESVVSRTLRPPPPAVVQQLQPSHVPGAFEPRAVSTAPPTLEPSPAADVRAAWRTRGPEAGLRECERRLEGNALSAELHHVHALLLLDLGRENDALAAARRTLYLDAKLAIAQFTLGSILERAGRPSEARRPYRNALDAAAARPRDELLPLTEGVLAGALAEAARSALERLGEG
jgi:chemotaxis protein methyltransferase CheR